MALVLTKVADGDNVEGKFRTVMFDVTLDASYPTNGTAITAASVGLKRIIDAVIQSGNAGAAKVTSKWDNVNGKLQCFFPTGGASSPTTLTAPVAAAPAIGSLAVSGAPALGSLAVSSGSATASAVNATTPSLTGAPAIGSLAVSGAPAAPALAGGIAIEVGNTTDLSALKVRMKFIGF